jgi:hypothetical protein
VPTESWDLSPAVIPLRRVIHPVLTGLLAPALTRCVLALIPLLVLAVAAPVCAQTAPGWPEGSPSAGPGWLPQWVALNEANEFSSAEKSQVFAMLDGIEAVLSRVPVLARPDGFQLEPLFMTRGSTSRDRLYTYQYRLRVWLEEKKEYDDPITRVIVTVNPYPEYLLEVPGRGAFGFYGDDEFDDVFYFAPHVTGSLPGGGLLYDGLDYPLASFVQGVYIAGGVPPYLPVSRERVLRAELARQEEGDSIVAAATSVTPYERWMSEAPARRELNELTVAQLIALGLTAEAASAKDNFERTEREVAEQLRESGFPDLAEVPSMSVGLRQQLSTMSPADLAGQACFDLQGVGYWRNEGVEGGLKAAFVPPGEGADCLVVGNRDFYASHGDPISPRIIDVWLQVDSGDAAVREFRDTLVVKVFETLDWAALASLEAAP